MTATPHANPDAALVQSAVKTIQMLAVDGVQKANSGHPGAPMGLASIAFEIWQALRFDPSDPGWLDRDRFVLSCGHASMLLYGLLHLSGYDVTMEDLQSFRQWGSKTPGHPEVHLTPGVETTTGPLGQGLANAVGMALGLKMLGARVNGDAPEGEGLISGRVIGICSDGDVMEGVSGEACSLAGHLGLDNLVFFYDDNGITIDGKTELAFSEDVGKRYEAYGWHVLHIDGHDHAQIRQALRAGLDHRGQPVLIVAKTHIGKGSPNKQDTAAAHGSPLGASEIALTKQAIGWPEEPTFLIPDEVRALFAARAEQGKAAHAAWRDKLAQAPAEDQQQLARISQRQLPADLLQQLLAAAPAKNAATRPLSGTVLQKAAALVPALVGGSADLTGSNKTFLNDEARVQRGAFAGRNFHFGIREHGMGAIANGLSLTGGFIPYTGTFLVFSDYMRGAIRLAALSHIQSIYVLTHDSLYLGEDGPTHQPVEHFWALRTIPNLDVVRPADGAECAAAWTQAIQRHDGPTALLLTRQGVPPLVRPEGFDPSLMLRGAYVLDDSDGAPEAVVLATGSEVAVAVEAKQRLGSAGKGVRIVSAPCLEAFARQDQAYRDAVLPPGVKRASVEVGITAPWRSLVGTDGLTLGHDDFGFSAPWETIRENIGLDAAGVAASLRAWL